MQLALAHQGPTTSQFVDVESIYPDTLVQIECRQVRGWDTGRRGLFEAVTTQWSAVCNGVVLTPQEIMDITQLLSDMESSNVKCEWLEWYLTSRVLFYISGCREYRF